MPSILSKLNVKFPCNLCAKPVAKTHRALCCDICDQWVHIKCNSVSPSDYERLKTTEAHWFCLKCIGCIFPRSANLFDDSMPSSSSENDDSSTSSPDISDDHSHVSSDSSKAKFLNSLFLPEASTNHSDDSDEHDDDEPQDPPLNCRYYDTSSLTPLLKNVHSTSHTFFHLNIGSLPLHSDDLQTLLHKLDHRFSVIGITETMIRSAVIPKALAIENYHYIHTPSSSIKGGSALFVRDDLNHFSRNDLSILCNSDSFLESCFLELPSDNNGANIVVGCIYKHPSMDSNSFYNKLQPLLHSISNENKRLILMGDFNINLLNADTDTAVNSFVDILSSYLLLPNINIPTRITSTSKTLIDNIFCNFSDPNFISGNLISGISDHLPQFLITSDNNYKTKPITEYYYRDWSQFDREQFLLDYFEIDWNDTLKLYKQDVDTSFGFFITTLNNLIDKYLPVKMSKNKRCFKKLKPWITPGLIKSMSIRDKLYSTYIHCKNPAKKLSFHNRYKLYRNSIVNLCRNSKKFYYRNFFVNNLNNSKKTWSEINSIINNKSKVNSINCLLIDNAMNSNPASISKAFNSYYASVADSIRMKIPDSYKHFSDFLPSRNSSSIFLEPCDAIEVLRSLNLLNLDKATGPFSIPGRILELLKHDICKPLSILINLSFTTGVFPTALKLAKVIAVYKNKGSPLRCSNYRPISLLSNIDKIYEKILYKRLHNFLTQHNILNPRQFGFRKSYSTAHALLAITQKLSDALDSGKFAYAVFVDLEKAFDTVDHSILLKKLHHYGIRGVPFKLLKSYLSERSQFVSISGVNSSHSKIKHGVPQGSVLGPLLFLIYINDLSRAIKYGDVFHFADDTNLLHINRSLPLLQKLCQKDLRHLCSWLYANKISLNASKTEFLTFKPKNNHKYDNFTCRLKIQRNVIGPSKYIRYLGVLLDQDLSWKPQIDLVASKLKRTNGILSKLRHFLPRSLLLQVYFALFHSRISYCCQSWAQPSSAYLQRICTLQNQAARLMTFSEPRSHASPIFSDLNLLRFTDLVQLQNILLIQKLRNFPDLIPPSLRNILDIDFSHARSTRGLTSGLINRPTFTTSKHGLNSIKSHCIRSWNSFISSSKSSIHNLSPTALKRLATKHFLSSY